MRGMVYASFQTHFFKGESMKKIKATEPNCLTELSDLKQKVVMYHQDTIDRLVQENIRLKERYEAKIKKLNSLTGIFSARLCEKYEIALQEIYQLCTDTLYIDDREAITNIMHIIEEVFKI